jgi:hypothetical protein
MRNTPHPNRLKVRFTNLSRLLLMENLRRQNTWLLLGHLACFGQQCQKQPSTKIVKWCLRKVKSGVPGSEACLRQPRILFWRNRRTKTSSVSLLPRLRTSDISSERFVFAKPSTILFRLTHSNLKWASTIRVISSAFRPGLSLGAQLRPGCRISHDETF